MKPIAGRSFAAAKLVRATAGDRVAAAAAFKNERREIMANLVGEANTFDADASLSECCRGPAFGEQPHEWAVFKRFHQVPVADWQDSRQFTRTSPEAR